MIEDVRAYLALPEREQRKRLDQLETLHFALTGQETECVGCNFYAMQKVLTNYLNQESPMATATKYTWNTKSGAKMIADSRVNFALTPETMTDEKVEKLFKATGEAYKHIISPVKEAKSEPKAETKAAKEGTTKSTSKTTETK